MKKFIFSLFFFSMMIVGAQAQKASCNKPCTKSAGTTAACQSKAPGSVATTVNFDNSDAAAKMASLDATIESRKDETSGNTYYVRKETCAYSGNVSYVDVNFDATTSTFVNVSPLKAAGTGSGCSKATSVSSKAGCSKSASAGKGCCSGKTASATKTADKVKS